MPGIIFSPSDETPADMCSPLLYMWRLIMPQSSYSGRLSIPIPHKAQCQFSHKCMVPLIFSCAFLIVVQFSGRFTPEWWRSDAFISNIQLARENIVCVVQSQLICFHLNFLQLHFQEGLVVKNIWERAPYWHVKYSFDTQTTLTVSRFCNGSLSIQYLCALGHHLEKGGVSPSS